MLFLSILSTCIPITAKAGYGGNGEVQNSVDGDIDIALESIGFDDHKGMKAYINGQEVFCIQRGYPFRSKVSELQWYIQQYRVVWHKLNMMEQSLL